MEEFNTLNKDIYFIRFTKSNQRKVAKMEEFLHSIDLKLSPDIEDFVVAKKDTKIVACGGVAKNVLKSIGIIPSLRGQGFVLSLMTELINLAYENNQQRLFLFSKPKNREFFAGCGFKEIQEVKDSIIFMENSDGIGQYKQHLKQYRKDLPKVGSVVINANPFTNGHRYLVKKAASECDWVHIFVVKEDASFFTFEDRMSLIRRGLSDIKNITIHEGSEYIISRATFPTYFLKSSQNIDAIYSMLDALIFKHHIAPTLKITHRYVGDEPYCAVTNEYNMQLKNIFEKSDKYPKINLIKIKRKEFESKAISASNVRKYLDQGDFKKIKSIVPKSTYEFLDKLSKKEMG